MIAFDSHLVHSSAGGERRVAWTIEYLCWPGEDRARLRHAVDESGTVWDEWAAHPAASPASRQTAIQRLRLLGVLGTDAEPLLR